ncbi:sensor histidine kinase [Microbacterium suaedae]|uniref:sensor histidine kinase n=1 Tax=Microbacterium suaedae TaxID=2067813 RepID=UPI000DA1A5AE|nr:histidine kinase [Microbacterium suaedae]
MTRNDIWQAIPRAPWRFLISAWPWRSLTYLAVSAIIGIVLTPIAILTLLLVPLWALAIGALERVRTRILGFPRQASAHVKIGSDQRHTWLGVRLTEQATWREVGAFAVDLVLGWLSLALLSFEAAILIVAVAMGVIGRDRTTELHLFFDVSAAVGPSTWALVIPVIAVTLAVFAYSNALIAGAHASLLRFLCGPRDEELAVHIERLTQSRAVLVRTLEDERRRIERDLHDGVQQELVAASARLGLVALELDDLERRGSNVSAAAAALVEARTQAEHALDSLRRTVRGIHPAVLTDRGLRAALDELAERAPLAILLDLAPFERPPRDVETAAYYLVSEAIANATKHTTSRRVTVTAQTHEAMLDVSITDEGHGGVDEAAGTGIRGLRERVEALGGVLTVTSPVGGPTTLRMTAPLESARPPEGRVPRAHLAR